MHRASDLLWSGEQLYLSDFPAVEMCFPWTNGDIEDWNSENVPVVGKQVTCIHLIDVWTSFCTDRSRNSIWQFQIKAVRMCSLCYSEATEWQMSVRSRGNTSWQLWFVTVTYVFSIRKEVHTCIKLMQVTCSPQKVYSLNLILNHWMC